MSSLTHLRGLSSLHRILLSMNTRERADSLDSAHLPMRHVRRSKGILKSKLLVELIGFEPMTPGMQSRCSPN